MRARANLIVALVLGAAVLGGLFLTRGYLNTWRMWSIPVAWPPFMDVRVITAGAEAHRRGLDPMVSNPTDSSQRRLNYPRIWQGLYALGVGPGDTVAIGVTLMVLFAIGVGVFIPRLGTPEVVLLLAAIFSPAILLGLERGNTDLLIFFLLAVAIAAIRRGHWLAMILVLVAFVLKLYPLLAVVIVLGQPRRIGLRWLIAAAVVAVLYVGLTWSDLEKISAATPRDTWLSYGMNVLWMKVAAQYPAAGEAVRTLSYVAVVVLAFGAGVWWRGREPAGTADGPHAAAYRVGAACYAGTFLDGNNFEYRLVFVLFALPQLFAWARESGGARPRAARIALAAFYVAVWSMGIARWLQLRAWGPWASFLTSEAAKWTLFGSLAYLMVSTAPVWGTPREAGAPRAPAAAGATSVAGAPGAGGAAGA